MSGLDVVTLILIFLLAGLLGATSRIAWHRSKEVQKAKQENQKLQKQLTASFSLGGYLLESHNEETAILFAMRAGHNILKSDGCAFVPFNEWKQDLPVLRHGELPFLDEPGWQLRLSEPATRHACRNCKTKQAGTECPLLQLPADAKKVYCVALRCGGREIGIISYFFSSSPPQVNDAQEYFLREIVRLTDLALDMLRANTQELEALRHIQQSSYSGKELNGVNAEYKELLEQLEYKAVIDERSRLAREIHDGLAQTLAFLKIEAIRMQTYIEKGETTSMAKALQACYQTLSDAYLDARQAIDNLRRVPDANLANWLTLTASDFTTLTGFSVDVSGVTLDHVFPDSVKAQLIRIVQEALTNIRKHAEACSVSISAYEHGGEAIIEVKDNGRGFSPEDVCQTSHYGLRSMRERAESIGADFQVISSSEMGTTIRLHIPICEKENS